MTNIRINAEFRRSEKNNFFDLQTCLDSAGVLKNAVEFRRDESIFSQGDAANSIMYIQRGGVKFAVLNRSGREAVIAMFGPGDLIGEGCIAGQSIRMGTATAIVPTTILIIDKNEMQRALHADHDLSDHFIAYMLARKIRVEEDLIDQLCSLSEQRLARTLLLLSRYGAQDKTDRVLPQVSQEILAEMIGTTRPRVNFFLNKFRKLGFIEYTDKIKVKKSLLTVVSQE